MENAVNDHAQPFKLNKLKFGRNTSIFTGADPFN